MAGTTVLVLVVLTMVVLAALTYAAVRFTRSALEPSTAGEAATESGDEDDTPESTPSRE